jgi:hypothetical protein
MLSIIHPCMYTPENKERVMATSRYALRMLKRPALCETPHYASMRAVRTVGICGSARGCSHADTRARTRLRPS